jgi:branched-chain amino acid transport system permease protein
MKKTRKISKATRSSYITYAMVIIAFAVLQIMRGEDMLSSSLQSQLIPICAYIVMAVSLNLTVGVLGELSLGHAGFMSVGAFTGAVVATCVESATTSGPIVLLLSMIGGAVMAGIAGVIIGIPVLRLRGDYLAIVTLAFGEIIKNILNCLYLGFDSEGLHLTTNANALQLEEGGVMIINGPMGASMPAKYATFTAGFILIMLTLIIVYNLVRSRAGRAIMALRDNRIAAESVGISVTKYKLMAFVISAVLAGAAGALYGLNFSTVAAKKFDFNTSILILVFVVLGGLGNIRGSIIAAALLTILPELLREFSDYRMLVYAIVLILVMLATNNPTIRGFFGRIQQKIAGAFGKKKPNAVPEGRD